ncbi:hypothetical protein KCH_76900 [Kitasatospora cheerisanensis KCTC 2395]|uniref:Uncharacterized protein n=1 Tax=Kitasatospora cheerisanensis KCTC 2395 TaxID=1348663 RepID=A0A066YGB7_9ACTN|nr:hypothetical protein KCH_76900 [Kitasatospora cheerisanensis KCTC 2395]
MENLGTTRESPMGSLRRIVRVAGKISETVKTALMIAYYLLEMIEKL